MGDTRGAQTRRGFVCIHGSMCTSPTFLSALKNRSFSTPKKHLQNTPTKKPHIFIWLPPPSTQIRSGTGGEEAALWAADLVRMYSKYADTQGWKVSWVSDSVAESGGFKEAVLQVRWHGSTTMQYLCLCCC